MSKIIKVLASLFLSGLLFTSLSYAGEGKPLREKLSKGQMVVSVSISGCDEDAKKYCDGLDKNSNKVMLCLTAYEDKLSATCKRNILEATMAMKMGAAAIQHSARACEADHDKFCQDVEPGQGRIVSCIKKHEAEVSKECITALKETGMWNMGK